MPKVAYLIDVHVTTHLRLEMARHFDVVFLAQKAYVEPFRQAGIRHVHWLPLACWPPMHNTGPLPRSYDVAYVGGLSPEENGRRSALMRRVAEQYPNHFIGKAWPEDLARIYAQSKIVVNACHNRDVNMRVFEALASGAMLITDEADGLEDLFEDGVHLVVYRTDKELPGLIAHYLANDTERQRIAEAGRMRVLREHTYTHRIETLEHTIESVLGPLRRTERRHKKQSAYYEQPRRELMPFIPLRARRILDIGCGAGALGRTLKEERGVTEVVGVEITEEAANLARGVLDQVFLGNIETMELPHADGHFDCIVCADVLEHLIEPEAALRKLARVLAPQGVIVISVPNARFFEVLAMLSSGAWSYQDAGILDYTHLRWFTRASLPGCIASAGLEAAEIHPLSMIGPDAVQRQADGSVKLHKFTLRNVDDEELDELRTYQFLALACKPGIDRLEAARNALEANENELALSLAVDSPGVDPFEQRHIAAKALARLGQLDQAERQYRDALALRDVPFVRGELGILLLGMNRPEEARPLLEQCLAQCPQHGRALGAMGLLLTLEGRNEDAFDHMRAALETGFDQTPVLAHILPVARALGRAGELLGLFRGYADFYPGNLDLACACAELLAESGHPDEARQRLETVLLFNPGHELACSLLQKLGENAE